MIHQCTHYKLHSFTKRFLGPRGQESTHCLVLTVRTVSYTHLDVYKRQHFALRTVTYGTVSASFLATPCLVQIGRENQASFPEAALAITNDFYEMCIRDRISTLFNADFTTIKYCLI